MDTTTTTQPQLADLVGMHLLDMRGEYVRGGVGGYGREDARVVMFRLDGVTYAAEEDPNDGYRSMMRELRVVDQAFVEGFAGVAPAGSVVAFKPIAVECRMRPSGPDRDDVLYMINERTGLVIFEIGTTALDDYYPGFVSTWTPEGCTPHWLEAAEP